MTDTGTYDAAQELLDALKKIRKQIIMVGTDVIWFDQITTLHDFCDQVITSVESRGMATFDTDTAVPAEVHSEDVFQYSQRLTDESLSRPAPFTARRLDAGHVPEGWKLVPIELTPEIACALEDAAPPDHSSWSPGALAKLIDDYRETWARVIAASPAPQQSE